MITRTVCARKYKAAFVLCLLLCFGAGSSVFSQQTSEEPLTNASVIKLVKAGFKEKTIVAIIQSRPNHFKMDTEQLIQLKRNGVGENIILAMLATEGIFVSTDEEWTDDSFYKESRRLGESASNQGQTQGADIFGSSSGSKAQAKQRLGNGSSQNDGNITGSATVRILRPPAEAGNSPAKLERTPTLDNEAIIRLVEAGFSEGTIIKRIEDSPVDFDLSPAKLDELHKRRVTEPIITAMAAAMNEAKPTNRTPEREN